MTSKNNNPERTKTDRYYRAALEALAADYTAAYICDLKTDAIELIKSANVSHCAVVSKETPEHLTSYSRWIRYSFDNLLVKESDPHFLERFNAQNLMQRLANQQTYVTRHQTTPNAAGMQHFEVKAVRLFVSENNFEIILGYHPIDHLIEKEEAANRQLMEKNRQLELQQLETKKANAAKSNFLRRMSHDIRTPINGIRGILEIASRHPDDLEAQREWREKVMTASGYLLDLVNNILDMGKLESGEVKLERKPFNLSALLHDSNEIMRMQSNERGIAYLVESEKVTHPNVIGSPTHLQQVIMNIASNAVKYNRAGGSVTVACHELSCNGETVEFELTCTDTGYGMSPEFQKHIFEPFAQEDNGAKSTYTGTGLGMAVAKELIELQGGIISFESTLNVGTKFTVRIPFEVAKEKADPNPQTTAPAARIDGVRILLVEDNELNMEIAEYLLTEQGAHVMQARNGQEAVDAFANAPIGTFDVVLMDVLMPVMNGLEATEAIRALNRTDAQNTPIVAMTANAFQDDIERSLRSGMNAHLTKPLNINLMLRTIAELTQL